MAEYDVNTDAYLTSRYQIADHDDREIFSTHTLLEAIGDPSGKTVIDLCCGDGRLGWLLLEMGAKSVIGVDISREMLDRAEERRLSLPAEDRDRIRFVQADLQHVGTGAAAGGPGQRALCAAFRRHAGSDRRHGPVHRPEPETGRPVRAGDAQPGHRSGGRPLRGAGRGRRVIDFNSNPESRMRIGDFSCSV